MTHRASRYHDFSAGHRVSGHESKCAHLHGHNYRVHFHCEAEPFRQGLGEHLDTVGRVIDFSVIKDRLCMWLENNWDHKFLAYRHDSIMRSISHALSIEETDVEDHHDEFHKSVVWVPFNPTAENMAQYLVEVIGPRQLEGTGVVLVQVTVEETAKCSATYTKDNKA